MSDTAIDRLKRIRDFESLLEYLRSELDWPLYGKIDTEDIAFTYEPAEVGLDASTGVKVKQIVRLRPLVTRQPWGIFYIDFHPGKLPVTVLRRILRALVVKKRASANERQAWQAGDLLFVSTLGEGNDRGINIAHFSDEGDGRTTLRVVDWDEQDSYFHLLRNVDDLHKLRWPDDPMTRETLPRGARSGRARSSSNSARWQRHRSNLPLRWPSLRRLYGHG